MFQWLLGLLKKLFVVKKGSYKGSLANRPDDFDDDYENDIGDSGGSSDE